MRQFDSCSCAGTSLYSDMGACMGSRFHRSQILQIPVRHGEIHRRFSCFAILIAFYRQLFMLVDLQFPGRYSRHVAQSSQPFVMSNAQTKSCFKGRFVKTRESSARIRGFKLCYCKPSENKTITYSLRYSM